MKLGFPASPAPPTGLPRSTTTSPARPRFSPAARAKAKRRPPLMSLSEAGRRLSSLPSDSGAARLQPNLPSNSDEKNSSAGPLAEARAIAEPEGKASEVSLLHSIKLANPSRLRLSVVLDRAELLASAGFRRWKCQGRVRRPPG
jgi:hypothetical protein